MQHIIIQRTTSHQLSVVEYATLLDNLHKFMRMHDIRGTLYADQEGLGVESNSMDLLFAWQVGYLQALGFNEDGVRQAITAPPPADMPAIECRNLDCGCHTR